ncbi:Integrase H2C2 domain-containing protein [Aphis craccivora]|uniref:Integrase H2C2 domain-containing protein n=1 Tax=Aphis craccivora TaxID=307492 RepID=A0A6G0YHP6_APHCR|nr:Integrase H2C2 domain-containing protein [Aphis craccivora]
MSNTGSEVNVIKIDVFRSGLTIDDTRKIYLKRLSKITIPLIKQGQKINTEFNLVDKDFPIRKHGIIEVHGTLLEATEEYHIVSKIAKHYNFMYIMFIITKNKNEQKTTYKNIYLALLNLKTFYEDQSLNKLAINKLGFNEKLEWAQVRATIQGGSTLKFKNNKILITCFTLQMALAQTKPYHRISRLTQENAIYFENQGPLRLTNSDWKLLIYVKLDNFNRRTKETMNFYEKTLNVCNDLTIAYEVYLNTYI